MTLLSSSYFVFVVCRLKYKFVSSHHKTPALVSSHIKIVVFREAIPECKYVFIEEVEVKGKSLSPSDLKVLLKNSYGHFFSQSQVTFTN